ncbi:MAG: ABC transporter ATP-binding protein [Buchananella hordeovulneris]|nr:ABC transporter ATP-binding protein [Buchananella hordeovulneris]
MNEVLPAAIEISAVTKKFGSTTAVDHLSLTIPTGQIVALLGKNGAGKTTLIDIVLGLQNADSGQVKLWGATPRAAFKRALVGVVHQTGALLTDYTVGQTLEQFAGTYATSLPMDQVLEATRLTHLCKRRVGKLSGGEQQRLRLALALLPDPLLLILDEPTAGMDASARREFWDLMAAQAASGKTIVFATHYLAEAEEFAQRTVIMKDGAVIADAPTGELRRMASSRTLRAVVPAGKRAEVEAALAVLPGAEVAWSEAPAGVGENGGGQLDGQLEGRGAGQGLAERELLHVHTEQTDALARALLAIPGVRDLEIEAASLEEAFTRLTD